MHEDIKAAFDILHSTMLTLMAGDETTLGESLAYSTAWDELVNVQETLEQNLRKAREKADEKANEKISDPDPFEI